MATPTAPHPMAPVVAPPTSPAHVQVPLKALRLRAGMFLQTQRLEKHSPTYEAQFLGAIDDKCLFVVPVGTLSTKNGMKANETFVIRGFTGQYDFQFTARVIQAFDFTFREPAYAYAVLTFPEVVQARKVRNSVRIKTSIAATAASRGNPPADARLVDLSVEGALLASRDELGSPGDLVSLAFSIGNDEDLTYVEALARICHAQRGPDDAVLSGVLFETIADRDRLRIREFVLDAVE
jgi:c-di-GMP-binding flagellar brake protein YcgR